MTTTILIFAALYAAYGTYELIAFARREAAEQREATNPQKGNR